MNANWWHTPDGQWRGLGNNPAKQGLMLATMGALPDVPESKWREYDYRDDPKFRVRMRDQKQSRSCNGHSGNSSLELGRYIAGMPHVDLSPWLVYADLCRGIDRGSYIADALALLRDYGTCEDQYVPYGTIQPRLISAEAQANRVRYKIEIGYRITTFREMCIACQLGHALNFSVPVNGNFNSLDKFDRPQNHAGEHNHAVTGGIFMKRLPTNEWVVGMQNSWGEAWGRGGYCAIGEKNIQGWGFDAYSVVATTVDPLNRPPRLVV